MRAGKIEQFIRLSRRIKTHDHYMMLWNFADSVSYFKFATDSEHGLIAAGSFRTAKVYLESMVTPDAIANGGWGWVEDHDGTRYQIGDE